MSRIARKLLLHGLLLLLLTFSSGTVVAIGPESPDQAPGPPVACVLVASQHANQLLLSISPVGTDLASTSAEMCELRDEPAAKHSAGEAAAVELVSPSASPGVTQAWWWVAWPWLMLLLALLSLGGYVLIRRQQAGAVEQPVTMDE